MKKTIKKGIIFWLSSVLTMILAWFAYAWIVWQVSDWQTLTADMWNNMAGNYDYSTDEVNTWKKWIDGKSIYRRVVTWTATKWSWTTFKTYNYDIENLTDSNIRFWNMFWVSTNVSATHSTYWRSAYIDPTHTSVFIWSAWSNEITLTLEYTKTTD